MHDYDRLLLHTLAHHPVIRVADLHLLMATGSRATLARRMHALVAHGWVVGHTVRCLGRRWIVYALTPSGYQAAALGRRPLARVSQQVRHHLLRLPDTLRVQRCWEELVTARWRVTGQRGAVTWSVGPLSSVCTLDGTRHLVVLLDQPLMEWQRMHRWLHRYYRARVRHQVPPLFVLATSMRHADRWRTHIRTIAQERGEPPLAGGIWAEGTWTTWTGESCSADNLMQTVAVSSWLPAMLSPPDVPHLPARQAGMDTLTPLQWRVLVGLVAWPRVPVNVLALLLGLPLASVRQALGRLCQQRFCVRSPDWCVLTPLGVTAVASRYALSATDARLWAATHPTASIHEQGSRAICIAFFHASATHPTLSLAWLESGRAGEAVGDWYPDAAGQLRSGQQTLRWYLVWDGGGISSASWRTKLQAWVRVAQQAAEREEQVPTLLLVTTSWGRWRTIRQLVDTTLVGSCPCYLTLLSHVTTMGPLGPIWYPVTGTERGHRALLNPTIIGEVNDGEVSNTGHERDNRHERETNHEKKSGDAAEHE